MKRRVLFLCVHNSARSQMAEAILRHLAGPDWQVASAGSCPTTVHPLVRPVLEEVGISAQALESKGLDKVEGEFDYVITLCEGFDEKCPHWPGGGMRLHWPLADPAAAPAEEQWQAFRSTRDSLLELVRSLVEEAGEKGGRKAVTRTLLQQELTEVQEEMMVMAEMVASAIERSIRALKERDAELARQIIADDLKVNDKRYAIEERCLEIIATQQPMASDLRTIISVLYIIVDLERMGDHAEGIAKLAILLADEPPLKPYIDIPRMAQVSIGMLRDAVEAFRRRDPQMARAVSDRDDEVDALYDQVYRELLTFMLQDPRTIQRATWLTWVAHNLERIADRATNICERVVYLVEGRIQEMNVSKY